jgi:hypothetical protein
MFMITPLPIALPRRRWFVVLSVLLAAVGAPGCDDGSSAPPPAAASSGRAETAPAAGAASAAVPPATPATAPIGAAVAAAVTAEPMSVDFGLVEPRTLVEAEITLRNHLDRPLRIVAAQPTCTCTMVDVTGETIPPNGTLLMPMSMQTSASVGVRTAAVTLLFEGVPTPLRVEIAAEVAYSVRAVPQPFIDALAPERLQGAFEVESVDGLPFRVLAVQGEAPQFEGHDPQRDPPRNRYRLRYDFTGLECPEVPKYLLVQTDRADCPLVDLRVRHPCTRIQPTLSIAEFRSMVGRLGPGERGEFTIEIRNMGRSRVDAVSTFSTDARVRIVGQETDGTSILCTIEVIPSPGFRGLLQLPVNISAAGRTTELLVYGIVD